MDTGASIWQGERVRLRAIEPSDWEAYFAWNQDDEQARGVSNIPFPQSAEAVRHWAQQEAVRKPEGDAFRFVIENETGEVVGDLTTHNCDARVGSLSYGITIRREHRRCGYAFEAHHPRPALLLSGVALPEGHSHRLQLQRGVRAPS